MNPIYSVMILICVLISLIGFLGIYSKVGNSYKNILPEYELASDLKGSTLENSVTFYEPAIDGLNLSLTIDFL